MNPAGLLRWPLSPCFTVFPTQTPSTGLRHPQQEGAGKRCSEFDPDPDPTKILHTESIPASTQLTREWAQCRLASRRHQPVTPPAQLPPPSPRTTTQHCMQLGEATLNKVQVPAGAEGEFSSPGSTFCAGCYFDIYATPVLSHQHVRGPSHSAESAGGRLQLNTCVASNALTW